MKVLVTGFEPFGGDTENAAAEAVTRLAAQWTGPDDLVTRILPVSFARAPRLLHEAVAAENPDAVICVGEAGGREAITPERQGWNRMRARIADNDGDAPADEPIDDGPEARPATLDVDTMTAAITDAGLPAQVSDDPGLFVCNRLAHAVALLDVPGVFVHVPAVRSAGLAGVGAETDGVAGTATALSFDDLARGLDAAVRSVTSGCARPQPTR